MSPFCLWRSLHGLDSTMPPPRRTSAPTDAFPALNPPMREAGDAASAFAGFPVHSPDNPATHRKRRSNSVFLDSAAGSVWTNPSMADSKSGLAIQRAIRDASSKRSSAGEAEISSTISRRPSKRQMMSSKSWLHSTSPRPRFSKASSLSATKRGRDDADGLRSDFGGAGFRKGLAKPAGFPPKDIPMERRSRQLLQSFLCPDAFSDAPPPHEIEQREKVVEVPTPKDRLGNGGIQRGIGGADNGAVRRFPDGRGAVHGIRRWASGKCNSE